MKKFLPLAALAAVFCARLEQPELISPVGGEIILTANPEFTWHEVSDARSYVIQISADQDFAGSRDTLIYEDTSFVLADTLKLGKEYYWRVTARTVQGAESDASPVETFYVEEGVEIISPLESDSTAWPNFSWKAYSGASSYQLVISRYADFRELFFDTTLSVTSLGFSDSLTPATYFWRVRAFSSEEPVSSWSLTRRLVSYRMADTYFPLSMEFSQPFNLVHGEGIFNIKTSEWDTTTWEISAVKITVEDTFSENGRLYWVLSNNIWYNEGDTVVITPWDTGDTVAVENDSLFNLDLFLSYLYPPQDTSYRFQSWRDYPLTVLWQAETLMMEYIKGDRGLSGYDSLAFVRLPGEGLQRQLYYRERIISNDEHSWELDSMELQ